MFFLDFKDSNFELSQLNYYQYQHLLNYNHQLNYYHFGLKYFAKKRILLLLLFFFLDFVAAMAQLAEHSTIKRRVRGSNPRGSTKFISTSTWHTSHTYFFLKFTHVCFFFWMFFLDIYFWNSHTYITSHTYISYHTCIYII